LIIIVRRGEGEARGERQDQKSRREKTRGQSEGKEAGRARLGIITPSITCL